MMDLEFLINNSGFQFNQHFGLVDWDILNAVEVEKIVQETDLKTLTALIPSILNYNPEKISPTKKIFRLSQLVIDLLLIYIKKTTFKINEISTQNISKKECNEMHTNKLIYRLLQTPGDNTMQIQEMHWSNKYKDLEDRYTKLKKDISIAKTTDMNHIISDYCQNCNFIRVENSSIGTQTENLDDLKLNTKKCQSNLPQSYVDLNLNKVDRKDKTIKNLTDNLQCNIDLIEECNQWYLNDKLDIDYYELNKLRLEARMNFVEDNIIENHSLLYFNSMKLEIILGNFQFNDDNVLLDLIKQDVKDIVNKRIKSHYEYENLQKSIINQQDFKTVENSVELSENKAIEKQILTNKKNYQIKNIKKKTKNLRKFFFSKK
ncbi:uncharacterized protein LOC126894913 [Daktulosphaira vitifoliae]|uniref:uncharacterized protein LOC126894913 n=1 Tax=Daktulosphaira vitifoliae TaxID=58002 RepID=UPI0021AA550B|nr:uncharacterized protein LOC126894913 [Daktulosphaira vitifoliae]